MDSIITAALDEICARGASGILLSELWPSLANSSSSSALPFCDAVKKAIWIRLLALPVIRFESDGSPRAPQDPSIQSVDEAERIGLRLAAVDHLRDSFLGLYDLKAAKTEIPQLQRRALERLGAARNNGITQCELAKEFGMKGNNIFYIVRKLESQQLIVRQSTTVRAKELGNEGEHKLKNTQITNTNLLHLYRYAKGPNLSSQQKIEIMRPAWPDMLENIGNADTGDFTGDAASEECGKGDVLIKDYLPAMKAICDKLEEASGKVDIVPNIKVALGYRNKSGHRAWRNILKRLKDAGLVEEIQAEVNKKDVCCLRLLKKFDPEDFQPKKVMCGYDGYGSDHLVKYGKRGKVNNQLVELPIEHCIYDMIDAEGPKGITISEVSKRLGFNSKKLHPRIDGLRLKFGICMNSEIPNKTAEHRVWTLKNYQLYSSKVFAGKCQAMPEKNRLSTESNEVVPYDQSSPSFKLSDSYLQDEHLHLDNTQSGEKGSGSPSICLGLPANSQLIVYGTEPESLYKSSNVDNEAKDGSARKATEAIVVPSASPNSVSSTLIKQNERCRSVASTVLGRQREQRILTRLKNEKFILTGELYRWLEDLEKDKHTIMDRKTLTRTLNKLQQEGSCRITQLTIPVVTNFNRCRKTGVILHPSICSLSSDLLDQIYKKLRSFEIQTRGQGSARSKNIQSVTLPTGTKRSSNREDNRQAIFEAMRANGFVSAKMVRAKLLHNFLWGYLRMLPDWQSTVNSRKHEDQQKKPCSTRQFFALDVAIKEMPLELFLQIVGSANEISEMVERCRLGLKLLDLPVQEYKHLMDTQATGRLSSILDILLRLKLIQLIRKGHAEEEDVSPHAVLTHAMELQPYIEEPLPRVLPSSNVKPADLHPKIRHDFVLADQDSVDSYWETLEYCYATADSAASSHTFPGSAVHEVFHLRSWASVRVMTAEQRMELLKRVTNDGLEKKIPFKECVKIARELNLTLEQVLRVSYDKCQSRLQRYSSDSKSKRHENPMDTNTGELSARKRRKLSRNESVENSQNGCRESHRPTISITSVADGKDMVLNSFLLTGIDTHDGHLQASRDDNDTTAPQEFKKHAENGENHTFIGQCAFPRMKPTRRERFSWTDDSDRQLIMQYARHRATLGVRFYRVDWTSLSDLPAPPITCARRMAVLKTNSNFSRAVMRLCNLLGERYSSHLDKTWRKLQKDTMSCFGSKKGIQGDALEESITQNISAYHHSNSESNFKQDIWDDFEDPDIKMAVDEALRYRKIKLDHGKGDGPTNEKEQRSSHQSRGKFSNLLNSRGISIRRQVCESLAVSNAVELLKLLFLSSSGDPKVQESLAATLQLYTERDLYTAFNYLKEKKLMVVGNGSRPFILSQKFWHYASSSPFPIDSGKRAAKFSSWLHKQDKDLIEKGVNLTSDLQCGEIFHIFAVVSSGEVFISPCLPEDGVGEADDPNSSNSVLPVDGAGTDGMSLKRKSDKGLACNVEKAKKHKSQGKMDGDFCSRREKGFPGVKVFLSGASNMRADTKQSSTAEGSHTFPLSYNSMCKDKSYLETEKNHFPSSSSRNSSDNFHNNILSASSLNESPWDTITRYATNLLSAVDGNNEARIVCPELFKSVHSIICQAGEQGLNMEEISNAMDVQGMQLAELVVDSLEVFHLAIKVNAYDGVQVVDSLYRWKFNIRTLVEHNQDDIMASYMKSQRTGCEASQQTFQKKHDIIYDSQKDSMAKLCDGHKAAILDFPTKHDSPHVETQFSEESVNKCKQVEVISVQDIETRNSRCPVTGVSHAYRPILPWINGDGSTNTVVYKGLTRRVLGTIMQHPGILEDDIICRMDVLNPQSCRVLLETMVLDNHITIRMMSQTASVSPPAILQDFFHSEISKSKPVFRKHYFANPMSTFQL